MLPLAYCLWPMAYGSWPIEPGETARARPMTWAGNKVWPGSNFEIPEPSGSCGSIRLVKLESKNPF